MKKMSFKALVFVTVLGMVMGLAVGCTSQIAEETSNESEVVTTEATETTAETSVEGDKEIKIGLLIGNLFMTWMSYASEGAKKAAEDAEVELTVYDAENKVDKQVSLLENLIAQDVDGIVTNPLDVSALLPALEAVDEAGIPLITFDRRCEGAPYFAHVGSDDVLGAQMAAEYIAEKLNGKGRVIELTGAPGVSVANDRHQGFTEAIAQYPEIEVVFSQTGEFVRETGMNVMENAINAVGADGFDAVFAHNDDMMMGALQAMKDANIDYKNIITVSYDGIPDVLKAISEGELHATLQYPVAQGEKAMLILIEYLKNDVMPESKEEIVNPWVITKDNIESSDFYPELEKME